MTAFTFTETLSLVITSCAGTSMVTVRNPTLTARSMIGISRIRPGPRSPTRRPRRNTTRRSYSRTTLIELTRIKSTANPTKIVNGSTRAPSGPMSSLPCCGAHPQRQSLDAGHHDLGAHLDLGASFRIPHLRVQSHAPARPQPLDHLRAPAEHRGVAAGTTTLTVAQRKRDQHREERHREPGGREHERPRHVHGTIVEQHEPAERQRDRTAHREESVAVHLDLGDEEAHAQDQQR